MKKHKSVRVLLTVLGLFSILAFLRVGLAATPVSPVDLHAANLSAEDLLKLALQQAQRAGSYRVTMDVQQTVFAAGAVNEQSARIGVEGLIAGPDRARLTLTDAQVRGPLPQDPAWQTSAAQDILITGGAVYQREGDRWVRQEQAAASPGLTTDALLLLETAQDAQRLDRIETLGGSFARVAFTLDSRDVLAWMLRQAGQSAENARLLLALNALEYGGSGELWIDNDGFPARLALNLNIARGGSEPYRARAASTALYADFGEQFPAGWFDPTIAPLSFTDTSPIRGSGLSGEQLGGAAMLTGFFSVVLALMLIALTRTRLARLAYVTLTVMLIASMVGPSVAQAAQGSASAAAPAAERPGAVETLAANLRDLGERRRAQTAALASDLDPLGDDDGDGLPNGYELTLGTNPFLADSDYDGLTDYEEVVGVDCTYGTSTYSVETDPLNPDSNADGIRDGDEFDRGACRYTENGRRPFAWDDDNDSDGVPDDLDLSPFTVSQVFGTTGANLSFETLASLPGVAPREMYYFEVQVVPDDIRTLQYAYKSALEWPVDDKGPIQHNPISGTTGLLQIAPFLEVTLDNTDVPNAQAMSQYGVNAMPILLDDGTPTGESKLIIPLAPVERGGKIHALQAKVLQDQPSLDGIIRWRNVRLKWGVQADVLRPDDDGVMTPSPTGSHGLVVYDEPYRITGVQTSRQGGAESLVTGAVPPSVPPGGGEIGGEIVLLRGALETQFLGGRLTLTDIYNRFNLGSTATITERWGITQTFRVSAPQTYLHVDQMLLTTNVTTTRSLLNALYPGGNGKPMLLIATEQRTATLNVDDLPNPNFSNLLLNLCVTEMVTSRTLKLASYRWDATAGVLAASLPGARAGLMSPAAGDWVMLGLEEVLKDIQEQYEAIYGTLEAFYNETVTILQMAMTTWYQGQTVIQAIGALDFTDITAALDDPAFYLNILNLLDEAGLFSGLPAEFRTAVEFLLGVLNYPGGPAQWLEDQWNTVIGVGEEIVGGFKNFASSEFSFTPDSLVSYTQTAINVLTWLASIFDFGFLGDAIKVLTDLLDIFKRVQELWATIQVLAEQGAQVVSEVLKAATGELASLSGSLQFVGLIISVFSSLFSMFMQIALGGLSVLGVIGVILKAVVEIAIAITLFVVATIFPVGTLVALAIGIGRALASFFRDWFGDVGEVMAWFIDPIGALLDAANPDPEPLATFFGNPRIGALSFKTFEGEPLGGIIAGQRFGFVMTGTVSMSGSNTALNRSRAWVQLGRYATGDTFELCGFQIFQYLQDTGQLDQAPNHIKNIASGKCSTFSLKYERDWVYTRNDSRERSSIYLTDKFPGIDVPLPFALRVRDYNTTARLTVNPRTPQINGVVATDISLDVAQLWENCGVFGLDCDVYLEKYVTPPSVNYVYMDILPVTLRELWEWEDLINRDPDADGLIGNQDQGLIGFDNGLCGLTDTHLKLDSEFDRLGDNFELFAYSSSPCKADTDADNLSDYEEFILGADPRNPDTDGDGLSDRAEVAYWPASAPRLTAPWRVDMQGAYPGLPDPAAFPNPRIANADQDGRSDKKEREFRSSPNAFDVSDIEIAVSQELLQGGGTRIRLTSFPWTNDAAPGLSPLLTLTLPVGFSGVTTSARLINKHLPTVNPQNGTPVANMPPNVYAWTFPPLTQNRLVQVTLSGLPEIIPADVVSLTVQFSYSEAGAPRQTAETAALLINRGGPETSITAPSEDGVTSAFYGPIRIQGAADDPEGVGSVQVCVTAGAACAPADWQNATLGGFYSLGWTFDWTPPADGAYTVRARASDSYAVPGDVSAPVSFFVDSTPPASASFDLDGTVFISTTFDVASLAAFTVTGQIADATGGAYVSGVGGAQVNAVLTTPDGDEYLRGVSVIANPGAPSSPFHTTFSLPVTPFGGGASPYAQSSYQLSLGANDRAGNLRPDSDTLTVIVDDTPPYAFIRVPQTVLASTLDLGGRADDTALSLRRFSQSPYPASQSVNAFDTAFSALTPDGRAYLVGDLNGDTLDDVLLVTWTPQKPLEAGIFFGRVEGFPLGLNLAAADVIINGEADFSQLAAYVPSVAANAPGPLDVNGDGLADLLIGDPNANDRAGRAYVLLGRRVWPAQIALADADWRFSPSRTIAFGGSVASAGDVDGDGLTDILVGAMIDTVNYETAYLYLGRERGIPAVQSRLYGRFCAGTCPSPLIPNLAGLGDTNGDGLSDILLASYQAVWLINGRPKSDWPATSLAADVSSALLQGTGVQQTVVPAGDVNGDGLRDMLVGDFGGSVARVFAVFGRRPEQAFPQPPASYDLVANADISFLGLVAGVRYPFMGQSLAPMGDLDRDGKDDFAFGRTGLNGGISIVLSGQILWLRDQSPDLAAYHIAGTSAAQEVGRTLSSGDVNGDGIRDVMIGAPGSNAALLFLGDLPPMTPSGVGRVEVGVSGPIDDPTKPLTETLPTAWLPATLRTPDGDITAFSVPLTFPASGDYRLYARATDRADNRLPAEAWYVGTTFVNLNVAEIPTLSSALSAPALFREGFLRVVLTGTVGSPEPIQHARVFDGERWTRLPLTAGVPGSWTNESNIKRSDQRAITFRLVARDALGNVAHAVQTLITDTLVAAPTLFPNLSNETWHTNITPTLTITWPAVSDAGGPVTRYAVIDQNPDTTPTTLVGANQVSRALNAPGVWYAHVRVVDAAGNQQVVHDGPYGVNRTRTPSAILPDGWLDFDGAEYTEGMMTSYDPYAAAKPALLMATWDASTLYLGFTGADWNADRRFLVYLDTRAGGSTTSLEAPGHTLPFAADFALVLDGSAASTLLQHTGTGWAAVPGALSFAATSDGTEIAFNRGEIGATAGVPVALLAYVATTDGVAAVIPASARPSTADVLTGTVTFADAIRWDSLRDGYPSVVADVPVQWIAPLVTVDPGPATHLNPGDTASLGVSIVNPDILPNQARLLTVTLGAQTPQVLEFVSLNSGATCVTCPASGREWVVRVNVPAEGTRDVAFTVRALTPPAPGVFSAPVTATLAYQGLPVAPQLPATAVYAVDNSVAQLSFGLPGGTIFAKPGVFKLPIFANASQSFLTCKQQVSINKGAGSQLLGSLGAVSSITDTLPSGYSAVWQVQVAAPNGQTSTISVTVQTDETPPQAQLTFTPVFTKTASWLPGTASDNSGRLRAVLVSLNRGPFKRATLFGDGSVRTNSVQSTAAPVNWVFPLNASGFDGETVEVVVRAVDAAGNEGPESAPVTVTLDATGPVITITESLTTATGTASDGSGVAQVQVSLDGGVSYQAATLGGETWSFDYGMWAGNAPVGVVVIRALDIYGNVTQAVAATEVGESPQHRIYLPLVLRQAGS
ncbi:MAG TPA: hypothetical protein PKZ84_22105 [Anaerolineae bacterium]|nr:hypothetical protein [Anaerolineae bacterium]